jgi:hypothetical protein
MGSDLFLSVDSAAARLSRTKRSIFKYIEQGLLTKKRQGNKVFLLAEEVEQLALELGADAPAMNRKTFLRLLSRVQKLEERMSVVQRILGMRDHPLRPDAGEAHALLAEVRAALNKRAWAWKEIETWASIFDRVDEVTLDSLQTMLAEPHPWKPLYELCVRMLAHVPTLAEKSDLERQTLHLKLDEGRKRMRGTILMWIEMGRGSIPDSFLGALDTDSEALLRRLATADHKSRA